MSFAHEHAWSYANVLEQLPSAELVAVCDDSKERLKRVGETYKLKNLYVSCDELLAKEEIDAVIITSENVKHHELALASIQAGKHIIVEKPIATTLRDADEMILRARRSNLKFQTAFIMRYHDAAIKLSELLSSGSMGKIIAVTATNHGKFPGGWFAKPELSGGGAIMDHTVHVADLIRWYTKDEYLKVYSCIARNFRKDLPVEDAALILCETKGGIKTSIDCSWSRPDNYPTWGDVYLGIFCEKGYLTLDAFKSNVTVLPSQSRLRYAYYGPDANKNMISDFIRVVQKDLEPRASGLDGRQALEVALAAYESSRKKQPVRLSS